MLGPVVEAPPVFRMHEGRLHHFFRRHTPDLPPDFSRRERPVSTMPRSTALTMSYTVRPATAAAVSASISTPVLSTVRTRAWMVTVERLSSRAKLTSQPVIRRGWQGGMSSGVRLAAMIPAVRATPSTSPLAVCPARIAWRVAGRIFTITCATASRAVSFFGETSTIRASPDGVRWERPRKPRPSRDGGMGCSVCFYASGVRGVARVADHRLHAVLAHQLELLQLADSPLLVRGEKSETVELSQLDFVADVVLLERAEFGVLCSQTHDQRFQIGHRDLLVG